MPLFSDLKAAYRFNRFNRFNRSLIGMGAKIGKDRKALSVKPYLEIEDSRTGESIYLSQPVIQRWFWYKGMISQLPYNLNYGVICCLNFLPQGIAIRMKKEHGYDAGYYLLDTIRRDKIQKIEQWAYNRLYGMSVSLLEWNSYFVIDGEIIFELRAYMGKNIGNMTVGFVFQNKKDAKKLVLPKWEGYMMEITEVPDFQEMYLATNGFPGV